MVWIDAKYKPHLQLLAHRRWSGVSEEIRREHRADLHQALAYASLADVAQVDSLLLYPSMGSKPRRHDTVATVTSGRRRVRLAFASMPFGYYSPEHEEADLVARVAGGVSGRSVLVACAELLARPSGVTANPYCSFMGIRS